MMQAEITPAAVALVGLVVALFLHDLVSLEKNRRLLVLQGIVFAADPKGTWHLFVTGRGGLVQLTNADGSDLAPAWSPDGHRIAFQSNRDGNWEIYVMNADGSDVRRLTDDDAQDGEPSWSPDGRRLAFVHSGRIYEVQASGRGRHSLEQDGEWPSWSRAGTALALDVEFGDRNHGIVVSEPGRTLHAVGTPDNRRPIWSPRNLAPARSRRC